MAANEKPGLLEQDRTQSKKHDTKVPQKKKSVNWLVDFYARSGLKRSEVVEILRIAYPAFDKGLLSKCEHPEKYGVQLTAKARNVLRYIRTGKEGKPHPPASADTFPRVEGKTGDEHGTDT